VGVTAGTAGAATAECNRSASAAAGEQLEAWGVLTEAQGARTGLVKGTNSNGVLRKSTYTAGEERACY